MTRITGIDGHFFWTSFTWPLHGNGHRSSSPTPWNVSRLLAPGSTAFWFSSYIFLPPSKVQAALSSRSDDILPVSTTQPSAQFSFFSLLTPLTKLMHGHRSNQYTIPKLQIQSRPLLCLPYIQRQYWVSQSWLEQRPKIRTISPALPCPSPLLQTCHSPKGLIFFLNFYLFFYFFISWRLITLQYCSGFCHTLTWISHGYTCIPHPNPPFHLPLHPIPLGLPSAPGPSTCLMHPTWAGDLFHPR